MHQARSFAAVSSRRTSDIGRNEEIAGSALIFSAERQEATPNILPTLTVAMNSLPGGAIQLERDQCVFGNRTGEYAERTRPDVAGSSRR